MWLSPILYAAVFVLICVQIYKYVTYKPNNFPPGPIRLPVLGSYLFCLLENFNFPQVTLLRWAKKYGSIYSMYLGDIPTVIVSDNEICKEVLNRTEFDGRPDMFATRIRNVGLQKLGIFFTDGPQWHEQRRFTLRHMRDYGFGRRFETLETLMAEQIQSLVDFMKYAKYSPKDSDILRTDGCVLLPEILYPTMLNGIMSVFGMEPALPDTHRYRSFRKIGRSAMDLQHGMHPTGALSLLPWIRFFIPEISGYKKLTGSNTILFPFFKSVIEEVKQTRMDDEEVRNFYDRYTDKMRTNENEENSTFSDDQLLMLTIDYMFPAVTAVTAVTVQLIYSLLHHPECRHKMQKEIDEVVGRGRLPTLDDRQYMPYTESVIREVLRKETLVPLGIPHRVAEDTTLRGYSIPKNTLVYTLLEGAHMDEKVWGDPENFSPERFISDMGKMKKDFSIPFGAGKRLCAGETFARNSLFLLVAALYQNFIFQLPLGVELPKLENKIPGVVNTQRESCWVQAVVRD
ncbi:Cytochrome P450 304a1 [Carabus blaptoides fortunei]